MKYSTLGQDKALCKSYKPVFGLVPRYPGTEFTLTCLQCQQQQQQQQHPNRLLVIAQLISCAKNEPCNGKLGHKDNNNLTSTSTNLIFSLFRYYIEQICTNVGMR